MAFDFPRTLRDARPRRLSRISDGDTPVIDQPVRMVFGRHPEKAEYAGLRTTARPSWTAAANASKTAPTRTFAFDLFDAGVDAVQYPAGDRS